MVDKKWIVYCHSIVNDENILKRYIGITSCVPYTLRFGGKGSGYRFQKLFYRAIQKYGWDNFKHEILFEGLTEKEAKDKEIELIAFYKSNNKDFGYNITSGGDGGHGLCGELSALSKPVLQIDSTTMEVINSFISLKDANDITGINFRLISRVCKGERFSSHGFIWCFEEDYDKIYEKFINNKNKISNGIIKEVFQINIITGKLIKKFNSISSACREYKYNSGKISDCCNGILKSYKGYLWLYSYDKEIIIKRIEENKNKMDVGRTKPLYMIDINTNKILKRFENAKEAYINTGISTKAISAAVRGYSKTSGGYIWEYAD